MTRAEMFKWVIDVVVLPVIAYGIMVLSDLNKTINELNTMVGILNTQYSNQEKRIDKLEIKVFGQ